MATNTQGVIKMPKTKTLEEKLINDHEAEKNLPEILKQAIAQADYLEEPKGNQIVANRFTGEESILTPLAYQVYTVAIFANDIMWHLDEVSKTVEGLPPTNASVELRKEIQQNHQKMYNTNKEIYFDAVEWFCDYYVEDYMKLLS